jgi:thiosulfate/3-mercaptopyruvate sulfurtransferase
MTYANPDSLVSTDWLHDHLTAPDVRIVDATWYMPSTGRTGRAHYEAEHITGAVFFDIDDVADTNSTLPHMMPSPEKFSSRVRRLGLGNGNRIVIYDTEGMASAATRVWWMFRYFGHKDVAVLDGGLFKWKREGRQLEDLPPIPRERHFIPRVDTTLLRDLSQMKANLQSERDQVVDARSHGRFIGTDPEPWPVLKKGRIPGAINVPWTDLIDPETRTMLPADALHRRFAAAGLDLDRSVVNSCGSGVTACVPAFALHLLGHSGFAVYDGSWAEWGSQSDTPAQIG